MVRVFLSVYTQLLAILKDISVVEEISFDDLGGLVARSDETQPTRSACM